MAKWWERSPRDDLVRASFQPCVCMWIKFITSSTDKYYSLDSEDDFRWGCRNVSHQQQFFSELPSPRRSHNTNYWYSWVQTIYYGLSLLMEIAFLLGVVFGYLGFSSLPKIINIPKFLFDLDRRTARKQPQADVGSSRNIVIIIFIRSKSTRHLYIPPNKSIT